MSWYTNQTVPDLKKMVPIFVHIDHCRNFTNFDLRLDGHYKFEFRRDKTGSAKLKISANQDFLALFNEEKINLNILCGINGVGKTTILKLLSGRLPRDNSKFVMVLGDGDGNYWANEKIVVHENGVVAEVNISPEWMDVSLSGLCANLVLDGSATFNIHRKIAQHYMEHRKLYDDRGDPHFTHLVVDFWDFSERISDVIDHINRRLGWALDKFDAEDYLKRHPMFLTFLCFARDNTFDRFFDRILQAAGKEIKNLPSLHGVLRGLDPDGALESKIIEFIGDPKIPDPKTHAKVMPLDVLKRAESQPRSYPIRDYYRLNKRLHELSEAVYKEIDRYVRVLIPKHHWHLGKEDGLDDVLYLCPFKKIGTARRFIWNLSSGEYMDIENRYVLEPCMLQSDASWIYWDEPDLHLHPEWKRQFIARFVEAVRATRKYLAKVDKLYRDKRYTFILTTHSPFLLSDVTNDHAILLDQDKRKRTVVRASRSGTFAGNIGAMFYDQFFMEETIGKYAESKIKKLIAQIERRAPLSPEKAEECRRTFSAVGDDLLRKLLLSKLAEKSGETN